MRRTLFPVILVLIAALAVAQTYPTGSPAPTPPPQTQSTDPNQAATPQTQTSPAVTTRSQQAATGREIAAGTTIRSALDTPLSTKTSKVGDRFTATVAEAVNAADGSVAIPVGAKIVGEVTEVEGGKVLPSVRGRAKLNMRFREIQLPNGSTIPLTATLVSVNSTKGKASTSEEGQVQSGTSGKEAAKGVGIGAAVGTVAGLIFGHAIRGLAIGAIAGGGYVLATGGKDVNLPAQTGLVLRVDQNMSAPGTTGALQPRPLDAANAATGH